jgi:membrane protein DedA with SNARE-associated domain
MSMQTFVACVSIAFFVGGVVGYVIGRAEGPDPAREVHSGPDDLEKRSRRAF